MTSPRNYPLPDRIRVAPPAAGANWTFTNTDGGVLIVRSVAFLLTTSAAVANRLVGLTVAVDTDTYIRTSAGLAQAASLAVGYSAFSSGATPTLSVAGVAMPWRDDGVFLGRGHSIASVTAAIDAGDQYSAIVLDVLRYLPEYGPYGQAYREGYAIESEG